MLGSEVKKDPQLFFPRISSECYRFGDDVVNILWTVGRQLCSDGEAAGECY